MSKTLDDLIRGNHLPADLVKKMGTTEPGALAAALEAMVYARSHDDKLHSVYPEKVYLGMEVSDYMAGQIGCEPKNGACGYYIKSDVAIRKVIDLLDALALEHALSPR